MNDFSNIQERLNKLVPLPGNLPIVYLLGDTGAGKTCFVRQLLGTTNQHFPSVRRFRTTVAPTEFIITNESEFKAAFVLKTEHEISGYVTEILEQAVMVAADALGNGDEGAELADVLGDSADERFRLRCFLDENARLTLAQRISGALMPRLRSWVETNFPADDDRSTAIQLAMENEFRSDLENLRSEVMQLIMNRVNSVCAHAHTGSLPESLCFTSKDKGEFVQRLKSFLSIEEGSISPVIEKARVRGPLKSPLIPEQAEIVVIDGEGIGHDAREARVLSARHLDYFNICDTIILVEDSEKPFTAGGKSALAAIAKTSYLPKLYLAFSRLDKVQTEPEERQRQIQQVNRSLRNVLHALEDEDVHIERSELDLRYFADMHQPQPDDATQKELSSVIESVLKKHGKTKARFVAPSYDFELLAGFLLGATVGLRRAWLGYIQGEGATAAPWQTQKAFTVRMEWKRDEYRWLKPVAEFTDLLITKLRPYLANPIDWPEEITTAHKKDCLERLNQQVSQQLLAYVRGELLEEEHSKWKAAADLRDRG